MGKVLSDFLLLNENNIPTEFLPNDSL